MHCTYKVFTSHCRACQRVFPLQWKEPPTFRRAAVPAIIVLLFDQILISSANLLPQLVDEHDQWEEEGNNDTPHNDRQEHNHDRLK